MSLAQIEYFLAVAETGAVSRAALRVAVSQPPLTRQIRMLEDELGTPLFARSPKGMRLLPAGEKFMVHAKRIVDEVSAARRSVVAQPNVPSQTITELINTEPTSTEPSLTGVKTNQN